MARDRDTGMPAASGKVKLVQEVDADPQAGFLIYLPFLMVVVVVASILMTLGMIMVPPVLISIPLKLFLFVAIDGWSRLMQGLILSYV
jgi:type III secretion protein R